MTRAALVVAAAAALAWAAPAAAQVPTSTTFTARITDGDDVLAGSHAFVFRIFDAETGGTQRWSESHPDVPVEDGLVSVALGANAPLGPTVLNGDPLWVEIALDGETMSPRLPLRSVPYASRAGDAATLGGTPASAFAPAGHHHDPTYVDASGDTMAGALNLNADLLLSGKVALRGTDPWLRLNQDGQFTAGTHSPLNLNVSGLTVGALYFDPGAGNLDVAGFGFLRGGGRFSSIALGAAPFGALPYPYETMQLAEGTNLRVAFGTAERMVLTSDGRLQMSTNHGDCRSGWFCNGYFWDMSAASILYSGLSQRSDARLKRDIAPIAGGLDTVRALRPVTFTWRDPSMPGRQHGFIAQEVREVLPDLVAENGDGMLSVDTQELLPILMQAVKELDAQNAILRAELDALRAGRPSPAPAPSHAAAADRRAPGTGALIALGALVVLGCAWATRRRPG